MAWLLEASALFAADADNCYEFGWLLRGVVTSALTPSIALDRGTAWSLTGSGFRRMCLLGVTRSRMCTTGSAVVAVTAVVGVCAGVAFPWGPTCVLGPVTW